MSVLARHSGLDIFKATPGSSIKPGAYTTGQLTDFVSRGLGYRLPGGRIAAICDPQDLNYWIAECKASYGKGSGAPEDSAGLRSFVQRRASALGLSHLIGSWSVPQSSADTGKSVSVPTPALDEIANSHSLMDGLTKLNRQGRLGEAAEELAKVAQAAASIRANPLADRYERKAEQMTNPTDRSAYRELARAERQKAGTR